MSELPAWLIWSNEHGMWWAPGERGYTAVIEAAGLYSEEDAERIVGNASVGGQLTVRRTGPLGEVLDVPPEIAVPCPWQPTDGEEEEPVSVRLVEYEWRRPDGVVLERALATEGQTVWPDPRVYQYAHDLYMRDQRPGAQWVKAQHYDGTPIVETASGPGG